MWVLAAEHVQKMSWYALAAMGFTTLKCTVKKASLFTKGVMLLLKECNIILGMV
ncbi:hypothetical protein ACU9D5_002326 [Cronobacter dublinensis]|uniref:hypothetical protein n=1 Tax=Cronobacter dublinensis TaxID=413497 RepID=UPI001319E500|nr:hypothetical protein [Cronobacter dublinensis]ELY3772456.1 hypothetical protein [Cronobacter dublinensis]NHV88772.1 hypothetical protein [Cronobacter dublinensis]